MRFVVDNKLYDTNKAELLLECFSLVGYTFDCPLHPLSKNKLYKSRKGTFYVVYKAISNRERIILISEAEAKRILACEAYDKYVELYGELEEG